MGPCRTEMLSLHIGLGLLSSFPFKLGRVLGARRDLESMGMICGIWSEQTFATLYRGCNVGTDRESHPTLATCDQR